MDQTGKKSEFFKKPRTDPDQVQVSCRKSGLSRAELDQQKTENLGPISTNWTNESHLEKPAVEYYLNIIILKSFEVVILSFFMVFGDLLQNLSHRSIGLFLIVFVILIVFLII